MSNLSYQANQVKTYDRDRFYTALFADDAIREALFALYAFNLEIAMIREKVTEPLLGKMRIQWWRDNLDGVFAGNPPAHEVALALSEAVQAFNLAREPFDRLLDARERDLDDTPFADEKELLSYVEGTTWPLQLLALQAAGVDDEDTKEAVRRAALAHGLTGIVRAVPYNTAWNRCQLPENLCRDHGFNAGSLFRKKPDGELTKVVEAICDLAAGHLSQAQKVRPDKRAMPMMLIGVLTKSYLQGLHKSGYDPFAYYRKMQMSAGLGLLLKLKYHSWRGRI